MAIKFKDSSSSSPKYIPGSSIQWEQAPTLFTKRSGVIMEIWGPTMTGRTTLALTAPGPIALISFHEKIDGVVQAAKGAGKELRDIRIFKAGKIFRGTPQQIQSDAWEAMCAYEAAYYDAFNWARTVIVDTHPEAWYLERLAEFGADRPVKNPESGKVSSASAGGTGKPNGADVSQEDLKAEIVPHILEMLKEKGPAKKGNLMAKIPPKFPKEKRAYISSWLQDDDNLSDIPGTLYDAYKGEGDDKNPNYSTLELEA